MIRSRYITEGQDKSGRLTPEKYGDMAKIEATLDNPQGLILEFVSAIAGPRLSGSAGQEKR